MSRVCNSVLVWPVGDDSQDDKALLLAVNAPLGDERQGFVDVTEMAGGYKSCEANVAVAAFNFVSPEDQWKAIESAPWPQREGVCLFFSDQEDATWSMRTFAGLFPGHMMEWYAKETNSTGNATY